MTTVALLTAVLLMPLPRLPRPSRGGLTEPRRIRVDLLMAFAVLAGCLFFIPLPWSIPAALLAAVVTATFVPRSLDGDDASRQLQIARGVSGTAQLLAALLSAGSTDYAAIQRAAEAATEPLDNILRNVARRRELGASAEAAWADAAKEPLLASVAATMIRGSETGAGTAAELLRLAHDSRSSYYARAQAAARSAAVKAVIPLAACFLPGFFLLGVVPIVAALGSELF